ncbi:MAG: RluA family pseudouridine synthase [Gemmatimonadaceae bacterium]|nr:RluA family pseudouridine synthase [Gemmatimonadaceae bacterium]
MSSSREIARSLTVDAIGDGQRLDLIVAAATDLSRTQSATLIATGMITVDGKAQKAGYRPTASQQIAITIPAPRGIDIVGESLPISVVFEDEHLLVVDKAAGMVVHPAPGNWTGTLVHALVGRGGELSSEGGDERAGIVHRLDKETSGLLIVAKTDRAHRLLSAALAARRIDRRYAALTWGHLREDRVTVEGRIGRDPNNRHRMALVPSGKPARTDVDRLARFDGGDLLRCTLHSGRTHQIRVHLSSIGHPVMGDDTYGGGGGRRVTGLGPGRHALHAASLRFAHPISSGWMAFRSPLPADLDVAVRAVAGAHQPPADANLLDLYGFYPDVADDQLPRRTESADG